MSKKVLIVDDRPLILTLLEHILESLKSQGVELTAAASGKEGLARALDEHFDLIFLDVRMPDLSGHEVCRRIKAADSEAYVVLLTGEEEDEVQGTEARADEHINKPFHPNYILERVSAILGLES
jgi:DNA-binding response OmpR family regulator